MFGSCSWATRLTQVWITHQVILGVNEHGRALKVPIETRAPHRKIHKVVRDPPRAYTCPRECRPVPNGTGAREQIRDPTARTFAVIYASRCEPDGWSLPS